MSLPKQYEKEENFDCESISVHGVGGVDGQANEAGMSLV